MTKDKAEKPLLYAFDIKLRSRYAETDRMGYVYHGRVLEYFEQARTEMIREAGISYKSLEDSGVMLPVSHVSIDFKRPIFYDELTTIRVKLYEQAGTRLNTYYDILSEDGKIKATGHVVLVFVDFETRKPCDPPEVFTRGIQNMIKSYESAS